MKKAKRPNVLDVITQQAFQDHRDASSAEVIRRQASLTFQIGLTESAISETAAALADLRVTRAKQVAALTGLSTILGKR